MPWKVGRRLLLSVLDRMGGRDREHDDDLGGRGMIWFFFGVFESLYMDLLRGLCYGDLLL